LKTKVKLLVGFYQISTLLHSSYNVPYPYTYLHLMEKIQFLSVDFTKALPGPCIFGSDYNFASKLYTMGGLAVVICAGSWKLVKFSSGETPETPRPRAKKAATLLPTALFLAYPGFSAFFFDALKCREIDGKSYLIADLSITCSGADYNLLQAAAITCVAFWCFGLPMLVVFVLWPERSKLLQGLEPRGFSKHLLDFCAPYKPQYWFFESLEFGKKLLLVGVVPAITGNLVGAVVALLIAALHLSLLLAMSPYAHKSDHFLAVCSNALLCVVILLSVLLKTNAAYIAGAAADGFDPETASLLLVASNILVVVVSVVAYVISARQVVQDEQGFDGFGTRPNHSNLQEPLLHSRSGTQTTRGEVDAVEIGGGRELLVAAAQSMQSSSSNSNSSDGEQ
jgi:hypothetical protein